MPTIRVIPVKKKYDGAIRTAIYCRVSSAKKDQLESLSAQISALTTHIAYLPNHVLYDTYIDIASGSTLEGRPGFQRLLQDCLQGNIQFVLTKSVSRFGRDVLVALSAINQLNAEGVRVYFIAENIYSDDPNIHTLLAAYLVFAEMENKNRSENIKWGINNQAKMGTTKIFNKICYGYRHDKEGQLVINEKEAEIVRFIFRYYLNGYSVLGIINQLKHYSIESPSGNDTWNKHMIEKTLRNIKYAGDSIVKTSSATYILYDHHPAIITRAIFDAVQVQLAMRSNITKNADGTTVRKSTKYSSKDVLRFTSDIDEFNSDYDTFHKRVDPSEIRDKFPVITV